MANPSPAPTPHLPSNLSEPEIDLLHRQREAEPAALELADRKTRERPPRFDAAARLLRAAERAPRMGKRIRILLQAASAWGDEIAPLTPCRRGCNACCHQPVTISSAEARLLAGVSGRTASDPPHARSVEDHARRAAAGDTGDDQEHEVSACPFLRDGECSVYEERPIFCRTHYSLADSDLLCQIVPGHSTRVPYADATHIRAYALLMQPAEKLADIRDFFPADTEAVDGGRDRSAA